MAGPNSSLLREYIDIPERASDSDFVLKLAEGVADAEVTLRDYVITDRLVENFDQALGLVQAGVTSGTSQATYLHGSFGAGKSHFMAVLYALLHGEAAARSRDEFAGLLDKHDVWLQGRRFLLVPYHMLGAKSMEQRILGGYASLVRKLHPEAPVPGVHRTDALMDQVRSHRAHLGDEVFLSKLPGAAEDAAWGDTEPFWTSAKLNEAMAAPYDDKLRKLLVSDLINSWFPSFFTNASEDAEAFVSLDRGLTEIAGHAKDRGYDGLILFLDELVLWLANSLGNQKLVAREVQKLSNLFEGGDARRPIPVISFIARQRDMRDLVKGDAAGAVELTIQDTLNLASGRFSTITLEDRNLPEIARRRLLKPKDDEAAAAIGKAFEATTKVRREVWDTLLGSEGTTGADIDSFRATYPFSPSFLDTLVHVSNALQRSRTGLKLMRNLLIQHRNDLRLGQLVPLGDLYDQIAKDGGQPFTERLKVEFENAQKLYDTRLRPRLLADYSLSEEDVERVRLVGATGRTATGEAVSAELAARVKEFTGDDRLMKTLLLSALAPSVPALANLTVRRLSALNHGSITSPIPGGEVTKVASKVRMWHTRHGEIKVDDGDDPGVRLELVGVDVDSVLANATGYNTSGARKAMVKRLLWDELGVIEGEIVNRADVAWKGSRRSLEVVLGNVRDPRDVRDDAFHPSEDTAWRLILDYPFDEGTYGPADARDRVHKLVNERGVHAQTVCWVPAGLTHERENDLGLLVVIDKVLTGQQFDSYAGHLNPADRQRARAALESQREALMTLFRDLLRQAYGLAQQQSGHVVPYGDHLLSMTPSLRPTLPFGDTLKNALRSIADQALAHQFPGHPDFDPDRVNATVKPADARTVLGYIRQIAESSEPSIEVAKQDRAVMRRVADALGLGTMHEARFTLDRAWAQHFEREADKAGRSGDLLKVSDLRAWTDEPMSRGLEPLLSSLVIACFAEMTDRVWTRHGGIIDPAPELNQISEDLALREQRLPDQERWDQARARAMDLFGINQPPLRRGRLVGMFVRQLSDDARRYRDAAADLVTELEEHAVTLGIDPNATSGRLHTARMAVDLLEGLGSRSGSVDIVEHLADADLGGPAQRAGRSIKSAARVVEALRTAPWDNFRLVAGVGSPYSVEANELFAKLRGAAQADEMTLKVGLVDVLAQARKEAAALLERALSRPTPPPAEEQGTKDAPVDRPSPPSEPTRAKAASHAAGRYRGTNEDLTLPLQELAEFLSTNPQAVVELEWRVAE
ncbi:phage resistance protein [Streptomyces sp. NPDC048560]|uniref:phage resistance protein n=1 Tax=Streptomyces sp. NPDC048560 TaxID=3155488 RepID=UPI003427124E